MSKGKGYKQVVSCTDGEANTRVQIFWDICSGKQNDNVYSINNKKVIQFCKNSITGTNLKGSNCYLRCNFLDWKLEDAKKGAKVEVQFSCTHEGCMSFVRLGRRKKLVYLFWSSWVFSHQKVRMEPRNDLTCQNRIGKHVIYPTILTMKPRIGVQNPFRGNIYLRDD